MYEGISFTQNILDTLKNCVFVFISVNLTGDSTTTKLRLLSQFQNVNESLKVFADYHNVGAGSLKRWIQQYLTGGLANLERPVHNRRYPKKLKLRAVRDYRNHRLPTKEILLKYDIRGLSQLRNGSVKYFV